VWQVLIFPLGLVSTVAINVCDGFKLVECYLPDVIDNALDKGQIIAGLANCINELPVDPLPKV
jgi:hypothetical protein